MQEPHCVPVAVPRQIREYTEYIYQYVYKYIFDYEILKDKTDKMDTIDDSDVPDLINLKRKNCDKNVPNKKCKIE